MTCIDDCGCCADANTDKSDKAAVTMLHDIVLFPLHNFIDDRSTIFLTHPCH
jgi:hypothetical protein